MTPKQPAPPTGSGGIGQKAEPEETSVESTHLATIGSGASARRSCLPWSQVGGVRSLSSVLDVELDELALLQGLQPLACTALMCTDTSSPRSGRMKP
jgi:hypothetical protein